MRKKKASVHGITILAPTDPALLESDSPKAIELQQRERVSDSVQQYQTLPEQIAKSKVHIKNWYVPELREKYKHFDRIKRIDLMFPYAKLKPAGDIQEQLLIDLPKNENEVEQCELKAKLLKNLGYRYCWLQEDSTLFDALMQLGE